MNKYIFIVSTVILFNSCDKPTDNTTNEVAFHLTAKVNNVDWYSVSDSVIASTLFSGSSQKRLLHISAYKYRQQGKVEFISLDIFNCFVGSTFTLAVNNWGTYQAGDSIKIYNTTTDQRGFVTITKYDTINNVVAGKFQFVAQEESSIDTVSITNGTFNLRFTKK